METLFAGIPLGRGQRLDDDQRARGDHAARSTSPPPSTRAWPASSSRARSRPTSSRSTSPRRSGASPIDPAMRLVADMIEWCSTQMPRWHPISISGYHIREAGSTAAQELAFTLKDGLTYVEQAVARGLDVDDFAPRLSFFFNAHDRLLRGDRQVPRGAPDLGARAARDVRRPQRALLADALPHPDRGRVADRPAAAEQHRAHGDRGARRRARRHAVAAHQLAATRRSRCRPRRPSGSRCARSRSSPTRAASRARSTHSGARTSSRR